MLLGLLNFAGNCWSRPSTGLVAQQLIAHASGFRDPKVESCLALRVYFFALVWPASPLDCEVTLAPAALW